MLQFGVALYCLTLWVGIIASSSISDPISSALALAIVGALLLIPLAPRVLGLLLKSLDLAPQAPPARPRTLPTSWVIPGAPGTAGAAHPRAPGVV